MGSVHVSVLTVGPETGFSAGLTLVEMLVTLTVAAILIGVALPAFTTFVAQRAMTDEINSLVLAVSYARSEAVRLGGTVSVQADDPAGDDEWGGGYCVVVGAPGNCDNPLRRFDALDGRTLDGVNGTDGNLDGVTTLSFDSKGLLTSAAGGSVQLCAINGDNPGRVMSVNAIGRTTTDQLECGG